MATPEKIDVAHNQLQMLLAQLEDVRRAKQSLQGVSSGTKTGAVALPASNSTGNTQIGTTKRAHPKLIFVTHLLPVEGIGSDAAPGYAPVAAADHLNRALISWHQEALSSRFQHHAHETKVGDRHSRGTPTLETVWIGGIVRENTPLNTVDEDFLKQNRMAPVYISPERHNVVYTLPLQLHYAGYAMSVLWPILHSTLPSLDYTTRTHEGSMAAYRHISWETELLTEASMLEEYAAVCRQFAEAIKAVYSPGDIVLVNDFQMLLLPSMLRGQLVDATIGLFLHSPFPSSEVFRSLSDRVQLLEGMLGADAIGFQTQDYLRHFLSCCVRMLGAEVTPHQVTHKLRKTVLAVAGMGIQLDELVAGARSKPCTMHTKEILERYKGKQIILGVGTTDAMTGVLSRLRTFEAYLEAHKDAVGKVVLIELVEMAPAALLGDTTQQVMAAINESVGRINGTFNRVLGIDNIAPGGPVFQLKGINDVTELLAIYAAADVLLIASHRDGMNMAPYEYVCARAAQNLAATVVISEFAGSSQSLQGAFMINPYNTDEAVRVLHSALQSTASVKRTRHEQLWSHVQRRTYKTWLNTLLQTLHRTPNAELNINQKKREISADDVLTGVGAPAKNRVVVFDLDDIPPESYASAADILQKIAQHPSTTLLLTSAESKEHVLKIVGDMDAILLAEDGAFIRWLPCAMWESFTGNACMSGLEGVRPLLEYFTERTANSKLSWREASVSWDYRQCDPTFGLQQARDLASALAEFTTRVPVVVTNSRFGVIDVRPAGSNKAMCIYKVLNLLNSGRPLFESHSQFTPRRILVTLQLRPEAAWWSRVVGDKAIDALHLSKYVQTAYDRFFREDAIDILLVYSAGQNRLDEDLLTMLYEQRRQASTSTSLQLLQQPRHPSSTSVEMDVGRLTMMLPPKPLSMYAATRAPSSASLASPVFAIHGGNAPSLDRPTNSAAPLALQRVPSRGRVDTIDDMLGLLPMAISEEKMPGVFAPFHPRGASVFFSPSGKFGVEDVEDTMEGSSGHMRETSTDPSIRSEPELISPATPAGLTFPTGNAIANLVGVIRSGVSIAKSSRAEYTVPDALEFLRLLISK